MGKMYIHRRIPNENYLEKFVSTNIKATKKKWTKNKKYVMARLQVSQTTFWTY